MTPSNIIKPELFEHRFRLKSEMLMLEQPRNGEESE
jgi:hypothetical protein